MDSTPRTRPARPGPSTVRAVRAVTAAVAGLTLATGLLVTAPATATPKVEPHTPDPSVPALPTGVLVHLAKGATDVQIQESAHGSAVAVLWQNPARTQVWARVKTRGTWRAAVRLSPGAATATRPSMDLDSDGSLLVGWAERRGKKNRVVARRLVGAKAGARRVFSVNPTQGPHVGAGPYQDVIAWTAAGKGQVERPFVSVDAGSGFSAATRIGGRHATLPDTLRVNSDGPQAHVVHLTRDTDSRVARSSWAVLDAARFKKWRVFDDVGPRQRYDRDAPEAPLITFHEKARVVMVFTNEQIAEDEDLPESPEQIPEVRQRWSAGRTWVSRPRPLNGFGRSIELHNPPGLYVRDKVTHLRNIRGTVAAAHSGDQGLFSVLVRPRRSLTLEGTSILSACRPFPEWFLPALPATADETPLLACVDNEADASSQLLYDLADNPLLRLAPATTGTVRSSVPDPLVAALAVTEDLAGSPDPVWLYDLTSGGQDKALPRLKFTRTKAGKLKGKTRVGRKLTATAGTWSPAPAKVTYRWYVGKKLRPKATKPTFKLKRAMRGKKIRVKVTVVRDGYRNRTVTMKTKGKVR